MKEVTTMPASSPAGSSPSTRKPRLLWRGVLHLHDGTALPGLAIVSSMQPGFSSFALQAPEQQSEPPPQTSTLFTLSKEQQDALSLSIEMVRHAPLKLLDIVENAEVDDKGLLCLPRSDSSDPERAAAATNNVHITFEAAGDVRMYIDPAQHATVAFFERLFVYEKCGADRTERKDDTTELRVTRTAIVFSLDKSLIPAGKAAAEVSDVFADPSWNGSQVGGSQTSGAMEAVVIGVRKPGGSHPNQDLVELHVGKKIARRILTRSTSSANARALSSKDAHELPLSATSARGLRPDDPAPRSFARASSQSSSSLRAFASSGFSVVPPTRARSSSEFVVPPPPSLTRKSSDARLGKQSISDDYGGENQAMPSSERPALLEGMDASGSMPAPSSPSSAVRKKRGSTSTTGHRDARKPRRTVEATQPDETQSMTMSAIEDLDDIEPAAKTASVEERNRSMVKKLVHHQLLGKGVERQEPTYAACYGATCQGTLLALRSVAKVQLIDRQVAASIVERHLDMYL